MFCKVGKVRKNRGNSGRFSEKSKCLKKKQKRKKFTTSLPHYVKDCKGFAPRILIDGFKEMFLYPLECREVPSGS